MSRKISVPVNKENVIRSGILDRKYADIIPDEIVLEMSPDKDFISKPELFLLDLLSNYQWDRPLNMLNQGGDLNIGIKDYLVWEGYSYKFVPVKNTIGTIDPGFVDPDRLYDLMTNVYKWDAISRDDYFIDYQNYYTHLGVMSQRALFINAANAFIKQGQKDRAKEMLDRCQAFIRPDRYPLESICLGFSGNDYMVVSMVEAYYTLGEVEKARNLAVDFFNELLSTARFYLEYYDYARSDFQLCGNYVYYLQDVVEDAGDTELAAKIGDNFEALVSFFTDGEDLMDEG